MARHFTFEARLQVLIAADELERVGNLLGRAAALVLARWDEAELNANGV